jgi:hypothetical protein
MSGNDDLERDIREEDETRRLLRTPERPSVPPFSAVAMRAQRGSGVRNAIGAVGALAAVVLIAVAVAILRPGTAPATAPIASPTTSAEAVASGCALPSSLDLQRHGTGSSLTASLVSVRPTDPQTNQLWWTVRYLSSRDAQGPATISVRAQVTASGRSFQQILGYEQVEPAQRSLSDGELVSIAPCQAATLVVRTGGLIDGTFPYELVIEKVGLPEGGTVTDRFQVTLACDARAFTCAAVAANATPAPTPTPNAALLRPSFGVIYWGPRQGWDPGSAPRIRREGETVSTVAELAGSYFNQFHGTVAPDGRRAAYPAQTQDGQWAYYLLDGSKPTEQRRILALPNEIPGRVVWSSDMTAIAFTAQDFNATQGVTPKYDSIRTLDLATGAVRELARVTDGSYYQIVGWDKTSSLLAAVVTPYPYDGAKPGSYIVIGPTGTKTTPLDGASPYTATSDARTVYGLKCAGTPSYCSLWTWPLSDYAARVDQHLPTGLSLGITGLRPGSADVGLVVFDAAGGTRIALWSATAGLRTAYRLPTGRSPSGQPFFRADGSAIVVEIGPSETLIVDLTTGATTPLPQPAPQAPYENPHAAASIRLD